jgi:predicted RNA methylase
MPTDQNPVPIAPDDPYAGLKPKDFLTDPEFHKMPKEAKRIAISKVWKEFGSASVADQDATIDTPLDFWQKHYAPAKKEEPGFFSKVGDVLGNAWEGYKHWTAVDQERRAKEGAYKPLPSDFGEAPNIDAITAELSKKTRKKKIETDATVPGIMPAHIPTLPVSNISPEVDALVPAIAPAHESTLLPGNQGDFGATKLGIIKNNTQMKAMADDIESSFKNLDRTNKAKVDEFNAKVLTYKELYKDTEAKAKKIQDYMETAAASGENQYKPPDFMDPEVRTLMIELSSPPGTSFIGDAYSNLTPEAKQRKIQEDKEFLQKEKEWSKNYGQVPLAEKIMSSVGQGITRGLTFGLQSYDPQGFAGEGAVEMAAEIPGWVISGKAIGSVGGAIVKGLEQIEVGRKYIGALRALPAAKKTVEAMSASGVNPETANKVMSQLAERSPAFFDALTFSLKHPKTAAAAVKALPGIEGGFVMATQSAIHDIATGEDPKKGISNALKFAFAGELLRHAPGIRNLAGAFKLNVENPDIAKMLDRMAIVEDGAEKATLMAEAKIRTAIEHGFMPSEIPPLKPSKEWFAKTASEVAEWLEGTGAQKADLSVLDKFYPQASTAFKELARQRHPEYEALKNMVRDHASQSMQTSIGTALQSATAFGLAAGGITAIQTEGDIKTKLAAGGSEGLMTFFMVGGSHLGSVMAALEARAGRKLDPGEAFVEWADLTSDARKQIVSRMPESEMAAATDRANEMSGKAAEVTPLPPVGEIPTGGLERAPLVPEPPTAQPAPKAPPSELPAELTLPPKIPQGPAITPEEGSAIGNLPQGLIDLQNTPIGTPEQPDIQLSAKSMEASTLIKRLGLDADRISQKLFGKPFGGLSVEELNRLLENLKPKNMAPEAGAPEESIPQNESGGTLVPTGVPVEVAGAPAAPELPTELGGTPPPAIPTETGVAPPPEMPVEAGTAPTEEATPEKFTGPLAQIFESDGSIDPKVFPLLNGAMDRAEAAGIADEILLGLIAGRDRDDIARGIIANHEPGTVPELIGLRQMISAIQQLKSIPSATSPEFSEWQKEAMEFVSNWSREAPGEQLPGQFSEGPTVPEPAAPEPPSETETTPPFQATLYQGKGAQPVDIYGQNAVDEGRAVPLFGNADYYAFKHEDAAQFGDVTQHEVTLRNPFILDSDEIWFQLLKDADTPHLDNMNELYYTEPQMIAPETKKLQDFLVSKGYDGIIATIDPLSDDTRRLSAMIGTSQVVKFPTAQAEGQVEQPIIDETPEPQAPLPEKLPTRPPPIIGEMPEGVSLLGPQFDAEGNFLWYFYNDSVTGTTIAVKPGENLNEKIDASRKAFEEAAAPAPKPLPGEMGLPPETTPPPEIPPAAGETPAALETTTEQQAIAPDVQLARSVAEHLKTSKGIDKKTFIALADAAYGGTRAEGKYGPSEAYDALELGINLYIQGLDDAGWVNADLETAHKTIRLLQELQAATVSQTNRSGNKDLLQQFSTPPAYAYAISWLANIKPGDVALESSAGTGDIALQAKKMGAEVHANEIDPRRAALLEQIIPNVTQYDAEQIGNILNKKLSPNVILMNPPFSHAGTRMGDKIISGTDRKHIDASLSLLEPNGRLVAIIGSPLFDKETLGMTNWLQKTKLKFNVRADVKVGRDVYKGYGTTYPTRVLIIDNTGPTPEGSTVTASVANLDELVDNLEGVRNDLNRTHEPDNQNKPISSGEAGGKMSGGTSGEGSRSIRPVPVTTGPGDVGGITQQPSQAGPGQLGIPSGTGGENVDVGSESGAQLPPAAGTGGLDNGQREPGGSNIQGQKTGTGRGNIDGESTVQPGEKAAELTGAERSPVTAQKKIDENVLFEPYQPSNVPLQGAQKHPASVVESASMAAVKSPRVNYVPDLPEKLIQSGVISDIQIEAAAAAGETHSRFTPDGVRLGFLLGDGTGMGKGRGLAAIILDNWRRGRRKAIWISKNKKLFKETIRDWVDLGQNKKQVYDISKFGGDDDIDFDEGILYSTYDTLKSAAKKSGKARLDQISEWLGDAEFDGVIVFDEAHIMGSLESERGIAGRALQLRYPKARIVYASATAATEIQNLVFAQRLGLWGAGTPFPTVEEFSAQIGSAGLSAMESVALSLKAMGRYMARSISFDDGTEEGRVEYDRVEHKLTDDQILMYNRMSDAWQKVITEFEKSLNNTRAIGKARRNARSQFWSAHQRFFNMMITSMQMPSVLERIDKDLADGKAIVLQLTNTGEADQERAAAEMDPEDDLDDFAIDPFETLINMVRDSFPTQSYEDYIGPNGTILRRPAFTGGYADGKGIGDPIQDAAAVEAKERLLDDLNSISALMPESPLDMIVNTFGADRVAEVTGRKRRFTWETQPDGSRKKVEQKRTKDLSNEAEINAFQGDKKRILVFSEAGGTGASYHADLRAVNQRKRAHYLLQPGWKADAAIQGLGRSHRSNQRQAPEYVLVHTDLAGQKRFISTIARRLGQLGALTKGSRKSSGSGVFTAADNLESQEAKDALRQFIIALHAQEIDGLTIEDFERQTGLSLRNPQTGRLIPPEKFPTVTRFLNRLLSMNVSDQNKTFEAFDECLKEIVDAKTAAGTLDQGVETIKGSNIVKLQDRSVYRHETGAEARYVLLEVEIPNKLTTWEKAHSSLAIGYVKNNKTGHIWQVETSSVTDTDSQGIVHRIYKLRGPSQTQYIRVSTVEGANYDRIKEYEARELWNQQFGITPATRKVKHHMITGAVLPIWDRLPQTHNKIVRAQTVDGDIVLGINIPPTHIDDTLRNLGSETAGVDIDNILQQILDGKSRVQLANGWMAQRALVQGEKRIELIGPSGAHTSQLERAGVIVERVGFKYRYFIPTGENMRKVWDAVTQNRPIAKVDEYNMSPTANTDPASAPGTGGELGRNPDDVGNPPTTVGRNEEPTSVEQATEAVGPILAQAQDSIDNILAGKGTIEDQIIVHINPIIAKHLMNWIAKQDSKLWQEERIQVDAVLTEASNHLLNAVGFDKNQAIAEAMHYDAFVRAMLDELNQTPGEENVMELASTPTILPTPPTTSSAATVGPPQTLNRADLINRNDIITDLAKALDVPIRYGRFRHQALGIFKVNQEAIRLKRAMDISTAAHEAGHAIHKLIWGTSGQNLNWHPLAAYRSELEAIATKPRGNQSKLPEGFAEFIRMWLTDPTQAVAAAPRFNAFWEYTISRAPELQTVLLKARSDYARWQNQKGAANVLSMINVDTPDYSQLDWFSRIYTGIFNKNHPLEMAVKAITKGKPLSAENDPGVIAQLLSGWAAKPEHFLNYGTFDNNLDQITGPGFRQILTPVKDRLDDLRIAAVALRTIEKKGTQNVETGISVADAEDALKDLGFDPGALQMVASLYSSNGNMLDVHSLSPLTPEAQLIKDTLLKLYNYQDALLKYYVKSGMMSWDTYGVVKQLNQFFVPFHRLFEPGAGETTLEGQPKGGKTPVNLWQPVKKMKGSWRPIEDPLESIIKNTYSLINIAERNMIGQALAKLADVEGSGKWIEGPLPAKMIPHSFALERIKEVLLDAGVNTDKIDLEKMAVIFVPNAIPSPKENIITVHFKGEPKLYQLEHNLYKNITSLDSEVVGPLVKLLSIPASILRAGATGYNPEFMTRNMARDTIAGWLQTNVGFKPILGTAIGVFHLFKKDDLYLEWLRSGAPHAAMVSMDREQMREMLADLLRGKMSNVMHHPLDALRLLSEVSESMTRIGTFAAARKTGMSIRAAALVSRSGGLDFQRIGAWMKAFNMAIPFLNANLQDIDTFVKMHKTNLKATLIKGAKIALISLLLYWLNKDDPDYHELPWWQRDLFWMFPTTIKGIPIPGLSKMTKWIPIPKPFIWGMIYANIPERIAEYIDTKDKSAFDSYFSNLFESSVPSVVPTALKTPWELAYNKNTWQGKEIESNWQQTHYAPEYRANWYTGAFAKEMALFLKIIGIHTSPLKIEHAIFSTTGGTGRFVAKTILDPLAGMVSPPGAVMPRSKLVDVPIWRVLATRFPHANLRSITKVESMWKEINLKYMSYVTSMKESNRFDIPPLNESELLAYGVLKEATQSIQTINRDIHQITMDPKMTAERKRDLIDEDYMLMLDHSRRAMKSLNIRDSESKYLPSEFPNPPEIK